MIFLKKYAVNSTFLTLLLLFCMTPCLAQSNGSTPPKVMPLSQVKEGMRGVARTVFKGSTSEEFNVEILGIMPGGVGPHQDLIIGKLSGANAERTFVFAGMSGSPVYVDGKLIGAISYSFAFSKEPICGITPIEQMISIFEKAPSPKPITSAPRVYSSAELGKDVWQPAAAVTRGSGTVAASFATDPHFADIAGRTFQPIATPMTFTGVSQKVLDMFAPQLTAAGFLPVAAAGSGSPIRPFEKPNEKSLLGGDSVMVQLARGDISIAAAGTVTLRDGEKVYAFGHPYFGLGATDLPMSESHVVTVVPNANNSFKLTVPDATVGTLVQDRKTGIFGKLGQEPKMIPVNLTVTNSRGSVETYRFESAVDDFLSPLIVNIGILNALDSNERSVGDTTIGLSGEITFAHNKSVEFVRRFTGAQSAQAAGAAVAVPLSALLKGDFDGLSVKGINLNLTVVEGTRTAVIERLSVDRTSIRAGETLDLRAYMRTDSGKVIEQAIPVSIPVNISPGQFTITLGDGAALQEKAASQQFVPRNAAELIETINGLKRPDKLYLVASRTTTGAIIGSSEMPNLPPTVLATFNSDRTAGGSKPSVQSVFIDKEAGPSDYIVTGSQTLTLTVVK